MYHVGRKYVQAVIPGARVNNAAFVGQVIDTLGFYYAEIVAQLGATDIAMTTLKVQESDVKASATALTGGTDVPGAVLGTDTNDAGAVSALPQAGDSNKIFKWEIDCRLRKRYLLVVAVAGNGVAGTFLSAFAELGRGQQVPTSAADKGAAQLMRP